MRTAPVRRPTLRPLALLLLVLFLATPSACVSWTTRTSANGLGSANVRGVFAAGPLVYAATASGLSISSDAGTRFFNRTTANGLGSNDVRRVCAAGNTIFAATAGGLSRSLNGGTNFTNKTTANGLGSNSVNGVFVSGELVCAATAGGLSISTDGGNSFENKTTGNGLGSNTVNDVFADGDTVWAATAGGLSISTNGGTSFTNKTTVTGLGSNNVLSVFATPDGLYAGTDNGLSISTDGGDTFTNYTHDPGNASSIAGNLVRALTVSGGQIIVATEGGVAVSAMGGSLWSNETTVEGLVSNDVYGVALSGGMLYAATPSGLSVGENSGSFTSRGSESGLGSDAVRDVVSDGTSIFAATSNGLSVSTDGGVSYLNHTTADGLGSNDTRRVAAWDDDVYVATANGLGVSHDGGDGFVNRTTANGLGSNSVNGVFVLGSSVYASTQGGLSISADQGGSFDNKTTANGLGSNVVYAACASGNKVYAATNAGLSISSNAGTTFTVTRTTANGLGDNSVRAVWASGSLVYAATDGGLSTSTDGGTTFTNMTTTDGLGSDLIYGLSVDGPIIYAATSTDGGGSGGLSVSVDGGSSFSAYSSLNGLASDNVFGVFGTGTGALVATDKGLSTFAFGYNWRNLTMQNGLGAARAHAVYSFGADVYAGTEGGGLSISHDHGAAFASKTTSNGLGSNIVYDVAVDGSKVYAATAGGVSVSTNGGSTFSNTTTTNGLGSNDVRSVVVSGSTIYAGTTGGLSISTDGGNTFSNKTTANGLADDTVTDVQVVGSTVYAATPYGLGISTNGGTSFTNKGSAAGVPDVDLSTVHVNGSKVYVGSISGRVGMSTNGGSTFTEIGAGAFNTNRVSYISGITSAGTGADFRLYVATNAGLFESADSATFARHSTIDGLLDQQLEAVFRDELGVMWLATFGGVSYLDTSFVGAPDNDEFANATAVSTVPTHVRQSTAGATTGADDPALPCAESASPAGVWFSYTPAADGALYVGTAGSDYDTLVSIWSGAAGSLTNLACADLSASGSAEQAVAATPVASRTTYYIEVSGKSSATGILEVDFKLLANRMHQPQAGKNALVGYDHYQSDVRLLNTGATTNTVYLRAYGAGSSTPAYSALRDIAGLGGGSFNLQYIPALPDGFYGGAEVYAESPVLGIVNSSDGISQNKGYTSTTSGAATWYLPAVFKNYYEWTTSFSVQNLEPTAVSVSITFSGQPGATISDTVPANSVRVYSQGAYTGLPASYGGSAVVTATGGNVAVSVAEESPTMADTSQYKAFPASAGGTTIYCPSVLKHAWGWFSDIRVQNVGSIPTPIHIYFYNTAGTLVHWIDDTLPANGGKGYNETAIAQLGASFAGSAKIVSDSQSIVVIVNELHDNGSFLTYEGVPLAGATSTVYAPSVLKNAWGWMSDIRVMNAGSSAANITVDFYTFSGVKTHTIIDTIQPNAVKGYNESGISQLGASWQGWAKVTSTNGQNIVGIVNEMFDGGGGIAYTTIN